MDAAKQREIASKGGQSVPAAKRSFSQDRRLAAEAGRKGGQSSHGGGRKQAIETTEQQAPASTNPSPMPAEREEDRESMRGEPEKVDSH
jgi:general stress protein YciG